VLHVTVKQNLRFLKNLPCGGAGEGTAIFLSITKRPVEMKLHGANGLSTQKIIIKNFRLRLHLLSLAKIESAVKFAPIFAPDP